MLDDSILNRLYAAFPNAIINRCLEFVAEPNSRVNSYFTLDGITTEIEVSCKLLEWLSREAYSSQHYYKDTINAKVHRYHRNGINSFLGTTFTYDDIAVIYQELGNAVNHEKTIRFIESGYDIAILRERENND